MNAPPEQGQGGGAVFHPEHDELHGFTVVLEAGAKTYVGRWDQELSGEILIVGATCHTDGDNGMAPSEFLEKTAKFGLTPTEDRILVPKSEVTRIRKLGDITKELRGF